MGLAPILNNSLTRGGLKVSAARISLNRATKLLNSGYGTEALREISAIKGQSTAVVELAAERVSTARRLREAKIADPDNWKEIRKTHLLDSARKHAGGDTSIEGLLSNRTSRSIIRDRFNIGHRASVSTQEDLSRGLARKGYNDYWDMVDRMPAEHRIPNPRVTDVFNWSPADPKARYMGIELEAEHVSKRFRKTLRRSKKGIMVSDASVGAKKANGKAVGGREAVLLPMLPKDLKNTLRQLPVNEMQGFRGAGVHIHVNRANLKEGADKWLVSHFDNPAHDLELDWMAGRQEDMYNVRRIKHPSYIVKGKDTSAEVAFGKTNNRYRAVNLSNDSTVEFRIFKGTNSLNELDKYVDATDHLVSRANSAVGNFSKRMQAKGIMPGTEAFSAAEETRWGKLMRYKAERSARGIGYRKDPFAMTYAEAFNPIEGMIGSSHKVHGAFGSGLRKAAFSFLQKIGRSVTNSNFFSGMFKRGGNYLKNSELAFGNSIAKAAKLGFEPELRESFAAGRKALAGEVKTLRSRNRFNVDLSDIRRQKRCLEDTFYSKNHDLLLSKATEHLNVPIARKVNTGYVPSSLSPEYRTQLAAQAKANSVTRAASSAGGRFGAGYAARRRMMARELRSLRSSGGLASNKSATLQELAGKYKFFNNARPSRGGSLKDFIFASGGDIEKKLSSNLLGLPANAEKVTTAKKAILKYGFDRGAFTKNTKLLSMNDPLAVKYFNSPDFKGRAGFHGVGSGWGSTAAEFEKAQFELGHLTRDQLLANLESAKSAAESGAQMCTTLPGQSASQTIRVGVKVEGDIKGAFHQDAASHRMTEIGSNDKFARGVRPRELYTSGISSYKDVEDLVKAGKASPELIVEAKKVSGVYSVQTGGIEDSGAMEVASRFAKKHNLPHSHYSIAEEASRVDTGVVAPSYYNLKYEGEILHANEAGYVLHNGKEVQIKCINNILKGRSKEWSELESAALGPVHTFNPIEGMQGSIHKVHGNFGSGLRKHAAAYNHQVAESVMVHHSVASTIENVSPPPPAKTALDLKPEVKPPQPPRPVPKPAPPTPKGPPVTSITSTEMKETLGTTIKKTKNLTGKLSGGTKVGIGCAAVAITAAFIFSSNKKEKAKEDPDGFIKYQKRLSKEQLYSGAQAY